MRRIFALAAILLFAGTAHAQMTPYQVQTDVATRFQSGRPGGYSAADIQAALNNDFLGSTYLSVNPSTGVLSYFNGTKFTPMTFSGLSGAILGSQLPAPTATTFGGLLAAIAPAHQYQTGNVAGAPSFAQPGFGDLLGTATPAQIPSALQLTGGIGSGRIGTGSTSPCDPGAWTGPVSPGSPPSGLVTPVCTGFFFAPTPSVPSAAVVGLGLTPTGPNPNGAGYVGVSGDESHDQYDVALIQGVTQADYTRQENGLHINWDVKTGLHPANFSNALGDYSEKTALYVTVRMDPGAGPTWAFNPDTVIEPGVGLQGTFLEELDGPINYNLPYRPGGPAGNSFQQYKGFSGFPLTAGEFWNSGAPASNLTVNTTAGSPTIVVTGGTVSVDDQINNVQGIPNGTIVQSINGSTTVVNYAGGGVVLSTPATATATGVTGNGVTFNMYSGISFVGAQLIRDTTIADGSNSGTTLKIYGTHTSAVDTQNATLTYALVTAPGQYACFANASYCLRASAGTGTLLSDHNFQAPLFLSDTLYSNGTDNLALGSASQGAGLFVTNAGGAIADFVTVHGSIAGAFPTISAGGTDANISLVLQGQGAGTVRVLSQLQFGTYTANAETSTGYMTVTDNTNTVRHLAVVP